MRPHHNQSMGMVCKKPILTILRHLTTIDILFEFLAHQNHPAKGDLMNNYWNNTLNCSSESLKQQQQQQQLQQQSKSSNNNINRSPVDLTYVTGQNNSSEMGRDIFVRSDSILTDDDYVPFEAPAQSKFGPISRMTAKTGLYPSNKIDDSSANQSFFNDTNANIRVSTENLNVNVTPSTATNTNSVDPSVWLYNNLQQQKQQQQKSPNYNYQSTELAPMKSIYHQSSDALINENISRDGKCMSQ